MNLTHELPNQLRLETHDDGAGHYVTCVCCTDGCGACYVALEHDDEETALREHEESVRALTRFPAFLRRDVH